MWPADQKGGGDEGGGGGKRSRCRCSAMVALVLLGMAVVGTVIVVYYYPNKTNNVGNQPSIIGETQQREALFEAPDTDGTAPPEIVHLLSKRHAADIDGGNDMDSGDELGLNGSDNGTKAVTTNDTNSVDSSAAQHVESTTQQVNSETDAIVKQWPHMATEAPTPRAITMLNYPSDEDNPWLKLEPYQYPSYLKRAYTTRAGAWTFVGYRYAHPVLEADALHQSVDVDGIGKGRIPWALADGTLFGSICPQPKSAESDWLMANMRLNATSDCLLYNLFMPFDPKDNPPKVKPEGTYPVYVHIHGGFNTYGSSAEVGRHGLVQQLVQRGILVVTFNYRLGWLGWLNAGKEVPFQQGLHDVETALAWVRRNVGAFGGDPNKITVGGQGSGACLASLVAIKEMLKPSSDQLFQQMILMSGSPSTCLTSSVYQIDPSLGDSTKVFLGKNCPEVEVDQTGTPTNPEAVEKCIMGNKALANLTMQNAVSFDWWGVTLPDGEYRSLADAYPDLITKPDSFNRLKIFAGVGVDAWSQYDKAIREHQTFFSNARFNKRSDSTEMDEMTEIVEFMYANLQASEPLIQVIYDAYYNEYPGITEQQIYSKSMRDMHITAPQLADLQHLMNLGHTVYLYDFDYKGFFHDQWRAHYSNHYDSEQTYFLMPELMWERLVLATEQGVEVDMDKELKAAGLLRDAFISFIREGVPSIPGAEGGGKKLEAVKKETFVNAPVLHIDDTPLAEQRMWTRDAQGGIAPMVMVNETFKGLRQLFYLNSYDVKF